MRSPSGVRPAGVRVFGDEATGSRVVTGDHWLSVPIDHGDAARGSLQLYCREVRRADGVEDDLPYLLFLQGGPGGRAPRPGADGPGWIGWALDRYRVLLLDQRGTGRSSPADHATMAGMTPAAQADLLSHFRADAIVQDAEALRHRLLGDAPWSVLGQSYGGFCVWTYLSRAPGALERAYVTGGIPPVGVPPEQVYLATHAALERRIQELDSLHPHVRTVLADVAVHLTGTAEHLPTGERLTPARLQEVGIVLGSTGGIDRLAHLADDAWSRPGGTLSDTFLAGVAEAVSFAGRPLYALLHESIYAEGGASTRWSAQRVRDRLGVPTGPVTDPDGRTVLPLTGEMIYPHTVAGDPALAPLAEAADLLAERVWTEPLYDPARLAANTVPVAACVYSQDVYVDAGLSRSTAARTGAVTVVVDDVHHHDGLRRIGPEVLDRLADALGSGPPARAGAGTVTG